MAMLKARYVKNPTVEVAGVTHFSYTVVATKVVETGGVATPGQKASLVTRRDVVVRVYGHDLPALLALIGGAKANLVCGYQDGEGTNRKKTFKNVRLTTPLGSFDVKSRDSGGKISVYGIEGHGCWIKGVDTLATMIVDAPDG